MVAVKELLKCQNCGNLLEEEEDNFGTRIICVGCGREHDEEGKLIPHPVGVDVVLRFDGKINECYGPR